MQPLVNVQYPTRTCFSRVEKTTISLSQKLNISSSQAELHTASLHIKSLISQTLLNVQN